MKNQVQAKDETSEQHEIGQPLRGDTPATDGSGKTRFLVSLPYSCFSYKRWLALPAMGIDARDRISESAPVAERGLILRAEEMQVMLEYVDKGEEDRGSAAVCEVRILLRLSAAEMMATDGWTFEVVDERYSFRPTSHDLRP